MPTGRPDWYSNVALSGQYDTTLIPVIVDSDGHILAAMKGDYAGALKTVAVDTNGIMKANLFVQDLAELITRPKYGEGQQAARNAAVNASDFTDLANIDGRGILYGGTVRLQTTTDQYQDFVYVYIDGNAYQWKAFVNMNRFGFIRPDAPTLVLTCYDRVHYEFACTLPGNITFETNLTIKYYENGGNTPIVNSQVCYALVG